MSQPYWSTGLVIVGIVLGVLELSQPIAAQVISDDTLPVGERSQVSGDPNFQIDGGARRGGNLFHSFSQFSVPDGGSAYFNNATDVQNILTRVTGASASTIDGLIQANGTANLFFLNPNGILFGPNGALDIGGSFVATTANAIGFPNGEVFSSDAAQPLPSQLLTVNPNALFFNQMPQPIVNQSTFDDSGLQVPLRQNLLLVGGPVVLDDGRLASPGSYVDIGSVGGAGTIGLVTALDDWQLTFPDSIARADVSLINDSRITLLADEGGSAAIAARNVTLSDESRIRVGIDGGSGFVGAQTGGIQIDATESVNLLNNATARIEVLPGGTGNVGDMTITTGSLFLEGNSRLIAATSGQGDVGRVIINARDAVSFNDSYVLGVVQTNAIGNTGGIAITTGTLTFAEGGVLDFSTRGQGNAGSVIIDARDRVSIDGENPTGDYASTIFTQVEPGATGQGGDVTITTGSLFLTNGGAVNTANTGGTGNAGRVVINASDSVQIRGAAPIFTENISGVFTSATEGSTGSGGDVAITTGSLTVADRGRIITNAEGQGNAGNIKIQSGGTVSFDGGDVISTLDPGAVGRGGDIDITARSLSAINNAQLSASTSGDGDAGNITVSADRVGVNSGGRLLTTTSSSGRAGDITVDTPDLQLSGATSGLFAGTTNTGPAGNLTIQPRGNGQNVRVTLQDGAQISASTSSSGQGGALTIAAPESITLTGAGSIIAAGTEGSGAGGNLTLLTDTLNIQNQAEVTVSSAGTGSAGSLFAEANRIFLDQQGSIRADTTGGGGNVNLRSPLIVLRNGSNITTNATGSDIPGGNVAIDTQFLVAVPGENSDISANSEDFRGGNVSINAFEIFGIQPRPSLTPLSDITATGATSSLSGAIAVTTAGVDFTSGLVALPTDLIDPSRLIAQGCPASQGNSFVVTGRGGLPPNPEQQLDDDADWQDRRRLVARSASLPEPNLSPVNVSMSHGRPSTPPLIEATALQIAPNGAVRLVAPDAATAAHGPLSLSVACQGSS
ncbi:filamentous hemagglutinin N-terminal domain-containing protein [Nodosilinea nodulosa]|uniref:two-partner secretion domain-containing protein n=1 Tax=Nodosilinea nodulosa TaxID=416001 RepID=UPI00037C0E76|nr:filamentous hemagglutinin N-terminal domain-containing protein [Nodosilinea nodulosa]